MPDRNLSAIGHSPLLRHFEKYASRFKWTVFVATYVLAIPNSSFAQPTDSTVAPEPAPWELDVAKVTDLRAERRFAEAAAFCRDRFNAYNPYSRGRFELVLELSRTLALHAVHSPRNERDALWSEATKAIDEFFQRNENYPRALLLRLQGAMIAEGRGDLMRREAELLPRDTKLLADAQKQLRDAITQLTKLQQDVDVALRNAPRPANKAALDALTANELTALERNVRYQIAKAQQDVAETYPRPSNDRIDALIQAERQLEPLAAAISDDEVVWQARVDRVTVERKLGRIKQANDRTAQLTSKSPPAWAEARLAIEQALLAANEGKVDAAIAFLDEKKLGVGGIDATEADDLRLQVTLQGWLDAQESGNAATIAARQAATAALVRRICEKRGPYWSRRAKIQVGAVIESGAVPSDAILLTCDAENDLYAGRLDDAVQSFDKAAAAAKAAGELDVAFRHLLTAAAIEEQQHHRIEAIARYASLARESPKHADAAKVHLQATWNAAHALGPRAAKYRELLDEHVRLWPDSTTADDARLWLGRALQSEQKWAEALATYRKVRTTASPSTLESAVRHAMYCCLQLPKETATDANSATKRAALAEENARWFESIVRAPTTTPPEPLSPAERSAVLASARLRLRYTKGSENDVSKLLEEARKRSDSAPAEWAIQRSLLVVETDAQKADYGSAEKELRALARLIDQSQTATALKQHVRELLAQLAAMRALRNADAEAVERLRQLEIAAATLLERSTKSE